MTEVSALQEKPIQSVEQTTNDLYRKVSAELNQAGHTATPSSVNPQDQSPLEEIKKAVGDTTHVVETSFEELVGGTSDTTYVRTAGGKIPVLIAAARRLKGRFFKKAA